MVGQLYQFIRMGFEGYREVNKHMHRTMAILTEGIVKMGAFQIISDLEGGLPLVAFHLKVRRGAFEDVLFAALFDAGCCCCNCRSCQGIPHQGVAAP